MNELERSDNERCDLDDCIDADNVNTITDNNPDTDDSCGPPAKQPAASSSQCMDVAKFIGTRISTADRYQLLISHFKPGANFSFPSSSSGRTFQSRWFIQYPWLVYSRDVNGGFRFSCTFFAQSGYHGSDPGILVSHPMTTFTKALELLCKHAVKSYHKEAVVRVDYCES